jgi:chromate transporter
VLSGFKPVVVAIVVEAVLKIGGRALKRQAHFILAAGAFVAIYFLRVPFPLIVLAAALIGLVGVRLWPDVFSPNKDVITKVDNETERERPVANEVSCVIDDNAPPPSHTVPSRSHTIRVLAIGLTLWALPLIGIGLWRGWDSLHVQEYRFFTQAALITFGGAYAVLAYVTQAAAGTYGWMTQAQAVDGLALAETTPGPLIMVLQFVGFMAAWNNPQGMPQTTSAVTGALITTYVTFLPCFLFIFLGAPYIEVLRGNKNLTGALNAVTAAVVGVILNLALVFGAAVIWQQGLRGGTDWFALMISIAAFFALYKFKADVLWVVLTGGLIGLLRVLLLS